MCIVHISTGLLWNSRQIRWGSLARVLFFICTLWSHKSVACNCDEPNWIILSLYTWPSLRLQFLRQGFFFKFTITKSKSMPHLKLSMSHNRLISQQCMSKAIKCIAKKGPPTLSYNPVGLIHGGPKSRLYISHRSLHIISSILSFFKILFFHYQILQEIFNKAIIK